MASKSSFKTSGGAAPAKPPAAASSSSLSSHLAMVELKSRILAALVKLSDRDTHQVGVEDLEKIIRTLSSDGVPMLLNALLHDPPGSLPSPQDPSGKSSAFAVARRESVRLLAFFCSWDADAAAAHLPKIIAHVVRRLKDPASDSSVRDACRDTLGTLSTLYLRPAVASEHGSAASAGSRGSAGSSPVVGLFLKPLFEAMGEQNKMVQGSAAMCLAKVVDCAGDSGEREGDGRTATGPLFQKLCPRICKLLGGQAFLAKGSLLSVVSSLAQAGAISSQSMQQVLQTVRECLESSDWATRKAAANTLCVMASHSSHLVGDGAAATVAALEASRFDKIKPVRDSMMEALVLWKKITGKGEDVHSADSKDVKTSESIENEEKIENKKVANIRRSQSLKNPSLGSLPPESDSSDKGKGSNISEKAVVLLKKKAPNLTDKDLNPEFFQKLETRNSNDLPVEVVVPRKRPQSSQSKGEEETEASYSDYGDAANHDVSLGRESNDTHEGNSSNYQNAEKQLGTLKKFQDSYDYTLDKRTEQRGFRARESNLRGSDTDDRFEVGQKDLSSSRLNMPRADALADGSFMSSKGNFSAIQRQLAQLERQQASLMNMLQDFMGGSRDSMITLENRVWGLERVVEEMARDLTISSGRRGGNSLLGFDNTPGRSSSRYNGLHDYGSSKFGRGGDARLLFSERFLSSDSIVSGARGRDPPWRSDSEAWDSYPYPVSRNSIMNSRRGYGSSVDGRLPKNEYESDQVSGRRAWDKAQGPFRFGEGPSARSVWQASKDEATLEAIRVAGEDNGTSRAAARVATPELDAEALTDDNPVQDKGPLWASWTRAMDSLHVGDVDSAYAEILSTGDDLLLMKLMDMSGPVIDQLSSEVASEVLRAVGQFLMEQSLFDIALSWLQQLADLVVEYGADYLGIPLEWKRDVLLNLHEVASIEPPGDWEGEPPDQLMMHLALAWGVNIQQLIR